MFDRGLNTPLTKKQISIVHLPLLLWEFPLLILAGLITGFSSESSWLTESSTTLSFCVSIFGVSEDGVDAAEATTGFFTFFAVVFHSSYEQERKTKI